MKILLLDQFSDLGGAQLCLLDLVPALQREGWEPHAALAGDGPLNSRLRELGAGVHELPLRRYSLGGKGPLDAAHFAADFTTVAARIRDLCRATGADVVYANGPRLMPALAYSGVRLPVVFHSHNLVAGAGSRLLVSHAIRRTRALVIAASRFVARQWGNGARVVYGGVEGPPRDYRPRPCGSGVMRVGMMGRVAPQKGQLEFVSAARRICAEWSAAEFVLCGDALFGDPAAERYKDEVRRLASGCVRWLGWRDDVYSVLGGLDLLVVPSAGEGGVPRVLLEAFAAGVPVLALDSGAVKEAIIDGHNGFLLASCDPAAMARRIREILACPERLETVAEHARAAWRERFTRQRFVSGTCALLGELTASLPHPAPDA